PPRRARRGAAPLGPPEIPEGRGSRGGADRGGRRLHPRPRDGPEARRRDARTGPRPLPPGLLDRLEPPRRRDPPVRSGGGRPGARGRPPPPGGGPVAAARRRPP